MRFTHAPWKWIFRVVLIRMISIAALAGKACSQLGKKMESSRRYILQAEISYWHEMLHLNRNVLSEQKEYEMRFFLKKALREMNQIPNLEYRAAA